MSWLRKVPGFRSGKRWKQVVATGAYAFLALTCVANLSGNSAKEPKAAADRPALLQYTIAESKQTSLPSRPRWEVHAVILGEGSTEQVAETCADVARKSLREQRNAQALVVFGYYEQAEVGKGFTRCRAQVSRDGKGWAGDGRLIDAEDKGNIVVDIAKTATSSQGQRINMGTEQTIRLPR